MATDITKKRLAHKSHHVVRMESESFVIYHTFSTVISGFLAHIRKLGSATYMDPLDLSEN